MQPFFQDEWTTLYHGHVLEVLKSLPENSVHCCVTSPPYWGLRDYGLPPSIWGGEPACEHEWQTEVIERENRIGLGLKDSPASTRGGAIKCATVGWQKFQRGTCVKCAAWRGCFGLEPTPQLYVQHSVEIFREVRRILRPDGTLWLNLGDSYASGGHGGGGSYIAERKAWDDRKQKRGWRSPPGGLKHKDLCGVPWRVAFALQEDGWYLRQDIVWHKPSCMPSSVTDRCTTAHEYLFLLSKSPRYYFDQEAIKEPISNKTLTVRTTPRKGHGTESRGEKLNLWIEENGGRYHPTKRNRRSVWTIATQPYAKAHFATFPPRLIEPCILAGTSEKGCCPACGASWKRVTEKQPIKRDRPADKTLWHEAADDGFGTGVRFSSCGNTVAGVEVKTIGWVPTCNHHMPTLGDNGILIPGRTPEPCTVLDPFVGSGTTAMVAKWLGRKAIGIDLSETYLRDHALERIKTPRKKSA